jgi:hypothetical protein
MKNVNRLLSAAALATLLTVLTPPFFTTFALALGSPCVSNCSSGNTHGAPGPIAGAGLPILAVGYGVYWLIKRRRKSD